MLHKTGIDLAPHLEETERQDGAPQSAVSSEVRSMTGRGGHMLQLALMFLVVGLVAALLGFTTIAGASIAIAKFLAGLFLVLFVVFLVLAVMGVRKVID